MRALCFGVVWIGLVGCGEGADQCEEGKIRDGDRCVAYSAGEPVPAGDAVPLPSGVTWQWQLTKAIDASHDVAVYDVDLFDAKDEDLATLKADGRMLLCYFSAGSYEEWRSDADKFPEEAIGKVLDGWPDERWVDTTNAQVRQVMLDRMDLAVERGCDGVEPDNVTAWTANTGFQINATEQLDFNRFLADSAHERGLSIALKNDTEQVKDLLDWFDYTVNEECHFYDECGTLKPFVEANKAVLNAEYVDDLADAKDLASEVCGTPGFSTIVKDWDLGPALTACP